MDASRDAATTQTDNAIVGTCHNATDVPTDVWSARLPAKTATKA
jgi:hypothetical protein